MYNSFLHTEEGKTLTTRIVFIRGEEPPDKVDDDDDDVISLSPYYRNIIMTGVAGGVIEFSSSEVFSVKILLLLLFFCKFQTSVVAAGYHGSEISADKYWEVPRETRQNML